MIEAVNAVRGIALNPEMQKEIDRSNPKLKRMIVQ